MLAVFDTCFAVGMEIVGNLRKMSTDLVDGQAKYRLRLCDVLDPLESIDMNDLIGQEIQLEYQGYYNSVLSGEKMNKPFGEGLTYKEFMESPQASPSIMRPELSEIHNGIALRDYAWEVEHHLKPHYVYISLTSNYKVGVTRATNMPYRWIDQGATQAVVIAEVPYRQLAGLIEVELKQHIGDKTAWQRMLKGQVEDNRSIEDVREELINKVPADYELYLQRDNPIVNIDFPLEQHPEKVKSIKIDKVKTLTSKLKGIKGQYLIFSDGVMNIRNQSGARVAVKY